MRVFKLISRNALRHALRTSLTILGVAIAVTAFCVIRSAIDAWYLNSRSAAPDRLISRNAVSLAFSMPISYKEKIERIPGVEAVSYAIWFGGIYVDQKNFFPKFGIDHETYFDIYPEYQIPEDQWKAFTKERNAVIVGRQLADRFGWKLGDQIRIVGDIYPGNWDFVIRGIYTGADETINESTWFFRYDYVDERMRQETPGRAGQVGSFVEKISDPTQSSAISRKIDALFANSLAETKTETEEAFRLSFVELSGQIILGLRIVSFLVIGVILLVMANTMAMAARERVNEYALLKTLGFRAYHLIGLVFGESLLIATLGGAVGLGLAFLTIPLLKAKIGAFLPYLPIEPLTLILGFVAAVLVGLLAAMFPALRAVRTSIVDGLRTVD
jgi:putative ABC transport system permease protein